MIEHDRNNLGALASGGCISSVPTIPTGKIGQPILVANRAAPVRPLYKLPSRLRVPSGNMPNNSPRLRTSSAASSAAWLFSPPDRSIGIIPIIGKRNFVFHESMYSALPTKEILRFTTNIKKAESRKLTWLGHRIAGPDSGRRSSPDTSIDHNLRATGANALRARIWA